MIAHWTRPTTTRSVGSIVLLLAFLLTLTSFTLQTTLNYPALLLMQAPLAKPAGLQEVLPALLAFLELAVCSMLLITVSRSLTAFLEKNGCRHVSIIGRLAGISWATGSGLGLLLLLLWNTTASSVSFILALVLFLLTEIGAPLLLLSWTVILARQLRVHQAIGNLGAIGLLLTCLRSLLWGLNALIPVTSGFYIAAGILNILAVIGSSFWLLWLWLFGFWCFRQNKNVHSLTQAPQATRKDLQINETHIKRRNFLRLFASVGVGTAGSAFVLARTGLTIGNAPESESDDVPAEPSLIASYYFVLSVIFVRLFPGNSAPLRTTVDLQRLSFPFAVSFERVNADGVPSQFVYARGATKNNVILYLPGGRFMDVAREVHFFLTAQLSQQTGAYVLMPQYRLAPEHPFPSGLEDCVTAYKWLHKQGFAASQIIIAGESAGGNLTLATALALRESGGALPAALVAISPACDLATIEPDPILGDKVSLAYASYTNHGAVDPHNPLVSPLYADAHGLPPTFLLAGTEEFTTRDTVLMADRLRRAGVEVKREIWPGMWHAWPLFATDTTTLSQNNALPEAQLSIRHITKFMRQHQRT
jgi:monoterpene epsilon-lactone hydrolase